MPLIEAWLVYTSIERLEVHTGPFRTLFTGQTSEVEMTRHLQANLAPTVRRRSGATWMPSAGYGIGGFSRPQNTCPARA